MDLGPGAAAGGMGIAINTGHSCRGKVMTQEANKLQMPFSANSIDSRDPTSRMLINFRSGKISCCFLFRTEKVIKADQNRVT